MNKKINALIFSILSCMLLITPDNYARSGSGGRGGGGGGRSGGGARMGSGGSRNFSSGGGRGFSGGGGSRSFSRGVTPGGGPTARTSPSRVNIGAAKSKYSKSYYRSG